MGLLPGTLPVAPSQHRHLASEYDYPSRPCATVSHADFLTFVAEWEGPHMIRAGRWFPPRSTALLDGRRRLENITRVVHLRIISQMELATLILRVLHHARRGRTMVMVLLMDDIRPRNNTISIVTPCLRIIGPCTITTRASPLPNRMMIEG